MFQERVSIGRKYIEKAKLFNNDNISLHLVTLFLHELFFLHEFDLKRI